MLVPSASGGVTRVAVGMGSDADVTTATLRDADSALRSPRRSCCTEHVAVSARTADQLGAAAAAQAVVEGTLLARYRYDVLRSSSPAKSLRSLNVVSEDAAAAGGAGDRVPGLLAVATGFIAYFALGRRDPVSSVWDYSDERAHSVDQPRQCARVAGLARTTERPRQRTARPRAKGANKAAGCRSGRWRSRAFLSRSRASSWSAPDPGRGHGRSATSSEKAIAGMIRLTP